jgi:outer membrane protein OmpA-like peptidoglycan-associated protein
MFTTRIAFLVAVLILGAPPVFAQESDAGRFLVYFDEFSANLTQQARDVIAEAAKRARDTKARGVRIEARASATGSQLANRYLALTRSQVVADELVKDGLDAGILSQVAIGQTGSGDPSVAERRVDIVVERAP